MMLTTNHSSDVEQDGVIEDITSPNLPSTNNNWSTGLLSSTICELPASTNSAALIVHINANHVVTQELIAQLLAKARVTIPAVMNYLYFNTSQIAVIYLGRKVLKSKLKVGLVDGAEDLKVRLIRFLMSEIWPPLLRTDVPDESLGDQVKEEQPLLPASILLHDKHKELTLLSDEQQYQEEDVKHSSETAHNNEENVKKRSAEDLYDHKEKNIAIQSFEREKQREAIEINNRIENTTVSKQSEEKENAVAYELAQENRWFRRSLESNMQVLLYIKRGIEGTKYVKIILNNSTRRLHFDVISNAEEHHRWELRQLYTRLLDNLETQKGIDSYESYVRDFYEACNMAATHATVLEYPLQDMVRLDVRGGNISEKGNTVNANNVENKYANSIVHISNMHDSKSSGNNSSKKLLLLPSSTSSELLREHNQTLETNQVKQTSYRWMSKLCKPESATLDYKSYFTETAHELKDRCVKFMCGFLNSYHEGKLVIGVHEISRSITEGNELTSTEINNSSFTRHTCIYDTNANSDNDDDNNDNNGNNKAEKQHVVRNGHNNMSKSLQEHEAYTNNNNINSGNMKSVHVHNDYVDQYVLGAHISMEELEDVQSELSRQLLNCVPPVPPRCVHVDVFPLHIPDNVWCAPTAIVLYAKENACKWHADVIRQKSNLLLRALFPFGLTLLPLHIPYDELQFILKVEPVHTPQTNKENSINYNSLAVYGIVSFAHQVDEEISSKVYNDRYQNSRNKSNNINNNNTNFARGNSDSERSCYDLEEEKEGNNNNDNTNNKHHLSSCNDLDRQPSAEWFVLLESLIKRNQSQCVIMLTESLHRPVLSYRTSMSVVEISVDLKRCNYVPLIMYRGKFFADWPSIPMWDVTTRTVRRIERNYSLLLHEKRSRKLTVKQKRWQRHYDAMSPTPEDATLATTTAATTTTTTTNNNNNNNNNISTKEAGSEERHHDTIMENVIDSPNTNTTSTNNDSNKNLIVFDNNNNNSNKCKNNGDCITDINRNNVNSFMNADVPFNRYCEECSWWTTPQIVGRVLSFLYSRVAFISVLQFRLIHPICNRVFENVQGTHLVEMLHSTPVGAPFVSADATYISRVQSAFINANIPVMPLLLCRVFEILGSFPSPYPYVAVPLTQQSFRVSSFLIPLFYRQHYFDGLMRLAVMLDLRDGFVKSVQLRNGNLVLETIVGVGFEPLNKRQITRLLASSSEQPNINENVNEGGKRTQLVNSTRLEKEDKNSLSPTTMSTETIKEKNELSTVDLEASRAKMHVTSEECDGNNIFTASKMFTDNSGRTEAAATTTTTTITTKHNFLSRHPQWKRSGVRQDSSVLSTSFISPLLSNTTRVTEREIEPNIPLIHFAFLTRSAVESQNTQPLIKADEIISKGNDYKGYAEVTQERTREHSFLPITKKNITEIASSTHYTENSSNNNNNNINNNNNNNNNINNKDENENDNNKRGDDFDNNNNNNRAIDVENRTVVMPRLSPWTLRHLLSWLNALLADMEHYYFFGYCERSIAFCISDTHEMCAEHLDATASVFMANKLTRFAISHDQCILHRKVEEWSAINKDIDC